MSAGRHSFLEGGSTVSLFPWLFQFLEAACRLGLWPLSPIFFKNDFFCGCTDFSLMVTSGGYCPAAVCGLSSCGLGFRCPVACGISQTRDRIRFPCIGRWIPIHSTAREDPFLCLQGQRPYISLTLLTYLYLSSTFKDPCGYIGPTQIT